MPLCLNAAKEGKTETRNDKIQRTIKMFKFKK